ncbi:MAG: hypothetical protein EX285_03910 [Thaumarchaeota archaeon]|nr:hypothetical protein [Nitrososphaerota archaeon]
MLGKIHSEEAKRKMSEFHKANPNSGQFKKGNTIRLGMSHSEETKRKMSEVQKARRNQESLGVD